MYLNIIKDIYDKPTGSIIVNSETPKIFPLKKKDRNETGHCYSTGIKFQLYKMNKQ